ncbi:hypothetical protein LOK49_LG10G01616 [Camellia lanceoleosa]|uniref:Uncharacterized protein n=1 Tax=Camellia lanceoleosa TaxID=1840588 RepID=A0ACC0G9I4_9ERIC|nr:hypothetical protein LOK49_LG10G01616 [Camellia lanceoleosa]
MLGSRVLSQLAQYSICCVNSVLLTIVLLIDLYKIPPLFRFGDVGSFAAIFDGQLQCRWVSLQPQGAYIELHRKRNGYRQDHFERKRKKEACEVHKQSQIAQKVQFLHFSIEDLVYCFGK